MRQSYVERFLTAAVRNPDAPAVVESGETMTYQALSVTVRRIAHSLVRFAKRDRVLIYLPASGGAYATMFGSAMAGATYCPINIATPFARQKRVIDDFTPDVIVSESGLREVVDTFEAGAKVLLIDRLGTAELTAPEPLNDLAYIMYTSGTTGKPKGVMIATDSLSHYLTWLDAEMALQPSDRCSQHANIAFDISVFDIYGALCTGAALYPMTDPTDALTPALAIRRCGLTVWNSVPSVLTSMIALRQVTDENLHTVRLFVFMGEPLYEFHLDALFDAVPSAIVYNLYGPTEATVNCTARRLERRSYKDACRQTVSIGDAIPGMELHFDGDADDDQGELLITGPQVAMGYWQDPARTAAAFGFRTIDGNRCWTYRTGDWVRREAGELYYVGRRDNQVKIRGERIELDDIAASIIQCGWGMAVVALVDENLQAFIECRGTPPSVATVREALAVHLPRHLVPSDFHFLDSLPLSANGKVDRQALVESLSNQRLPTRRPSC